MDFVPQWVNMPAAPTDVVFRITNGVVRQNSEVSSDGSGTLYAEQLSLTRQEPDAQVSTAQVAAVLDRIGLKGQCVGAAFTPYDQADFICRAIETCDAPNGENYQITSTKGLWRLNSLQASRSADATISLQYDAFTPDGSTHPLTITPDVAEPATVNGDRFRLGECQLAGVWFKEIDDVTLSFGVGLTDKDPRPPTIYPETAGVPTVRPTLVLRGRDLRRVVPGSTLGLGAAAGAHVNCVVQLLKLVDGGSYVDVATAQHIVITFAGLVVPDELISGGGGSRGANSIMLTASGNPSVLPVQWDTTFVYTAGSGY